MKKRVLDIHTKLYDRLPNWLYLALLSIMPLLFFVLGVLILRLGMTVLLTPFKVINPDIVAIARANGFVRLSLFSGPIFLLFAWVKWVEKRPISSLGFYKEKGFSQFVKGWGIGLVLFVSSVIITCLFGGARLENVDFSLQTIAYSLSILPFWVLQGGTEEVLTRGWLLPLLNKRLPLAWAIGISGTLFGLMHFTNPSISLIPLLQTILAGIIMALYFLKTDNLWGIIGLHGAWNFANNLFGVETSGPAVFRMVTNVGQEWLYLVGCLVLFLAILWLVKDLKKEGKLQKTS